MSRRGFKALYRREARVFAALGDATRLGLVRRLARGGRRSITELAEATTMTRQGVTKHLRVLEAAGLVRGVREGRESVFEVDLGPVMEMEVFLGKVSAEWDGALARLKKRVEG